MLEMPIVAGAGGGVGASTVASALGAGRRRAVPRREGRYTCWCAG